MFSQEETECLFVQAMLKKGYKMIVDPDRPPLDKSFLESPGKSPGKSPGESPGESTGESTSSSSRASSLERSRNVVDDEDSEDERPLSMRRRELETDAKRPERPVTLAAGATPHHTAPHTAPLCYTASSTACHTACRHVVTA